MLKIHTFKHAFANGGQLSVALFTFHFISCV